VNDVSNSVSKKKITPNTMNQKKWNGSNNVTSSSPYMTGFKKSIQFPLFLIFLNTTAEASKKNVLHIFLPPFLNFHHNSKILQTSHQNELPANRGFRKKCSVNFLLHFEFFLIYSGSHFFMYPSQLCLPLFTMLDGTHKG